MAMGTRKQRERQSDLWIATADIADTPGHAFYERLDELLTEHRFDRRLEHLCRRFYKSQYGQPSIAPGVYFRLLLIGYFEGLDSERGIAWRVADSLSLRKFIAYGLDEKTPHHSTISRTRRLFWLSMHRAVFTWVLQILAEEGLLVGQTVAVDATTLEANAAIRSIVSRASGQSYEAFITALAEAEGIETPNREQLARFDRKRKKSMSNQDWMSPHDPDSRITKMKDGRTHLAYKAEHAVDLDSGALLAVNLLPADVGDTRSLGETFNEAQKRLQTVTGASAPEVVADKGYHSDAVLEEMDELEIRTYIAEPDRGRRRWGGKTAEQKRLYGNRRRLRGARSKRLQRRRSELAERTFAHMYETGGMRRLHLRGRQNILKRLVVQGAGFNLGLAMRKRFGVGKPRQPGRPTGSALTPIFALMGLLRVLVTFILRLFGHFEFRNRPVSRLMSPFREAAVRT
jgi:transposase